MSVNNDSTQRDSIFVNARREAIVILSVWAACCVFTCGYCYLCGYLTHPPHASSTGPAVGAMIGELSAFDRTPESMTFPLGWGIPDWVFYGVILPWLFCILFTIWFVLFYFKDDDLSA